jgi:hypothetical protein
MLTYFTGSVNEDLAQRLAGLLKFYHRRAA